MRASGILLPVSSLPGKYGIGCFSKEAYDFVDVLEKANQKYWQILPIGQQATEIHHISHFQLLQEILILLVWKN